MEAMRIRFAIVMMLIAVFAVQNAAAAEGPAPAPASDAAAIVPAAFASLVALAFGFLF